MTVHVLQRRQRLQRPLDEVFQFFAAARNLERITPPFLRFEVQEPAPTEMVVGTVIDYRLHLHGIPLAWTSQIEVWNPDPPIPQFVDRSIYGPFALWHHRHRFEADGDATIVSDEVHWAIPFGRLGELARPLFVQRDLDAIFDYRHRSVARILAG